MASYMQEINILRSLLLVFGTLSLVRTTNIDCNGKAFHCMNSTHFMICVDIGRGLSSTVDDFVIPCPMKTECRITNRFECEYPPASSTTTMVSATNQVNDFASTIKKMETTTSATTSLKKEKYVTVLETSFLEEGVTTGPYTTADDVPPHANEILENVTEQNLDFQVNEIDIGNGLNVLTTIAPNDLDIIVTDPTSTITSTQDTTISESITQVDEIPTIIHDLATNSTRYDTAPINIVYVQNSMDFATENNIFVDVMRHRLSNGSINLTTATGLSTSNLVFTPNSEFTTETLYSENSTSNKATTKNSKIVTNRNILNENILYTTKDDYGTTSTDSVLTTDNIFVTDNTDTTTEFRTTILDIQDSFNMAPNIVSPTENTVGDVVDSSTVLINVFNGFTTELVPTQNMEVPLRSYTSLHDMPAIDSTNYTTVNQDAKKYSSYNNEATEITVITTKNDSQISASITEIIPQHDSNTPSGTTISEASIILDKYNIEPEISDMHDLTTDYTEKPFLTTSFNTFADDNTQHNTNYTTLNSGGIITNGKDSKKMSNVDITKLETDATTLYNVFLTTIANEVETAAEYFDQVELDMNIYRKRSSITSENLTLARPVELPQLSNEYGADVIEKQTEYTTVLTENINTSSIIKVTAETDTQHYAETTTVFLDFINLNETATTTSRYNMLGIEQPREKETVKKLTSKVDSTVAATSSNINNTTMMSKTHEGTLQELLTQADIENFTSKMYLIPNIMSTTVSADIDQVAKDKLFLGPNELSSYGEKSNLLNNNTTTNSIQTTESTTDDSTKITQITTQSTLNDYFNYHNTVTLANSEMAMNNETATTTQINIEKGIIGTISLKNVSSNKLQGVQNTTFDIKNEMVSTTMASDSDIQIEQIAYVTVPVDTGKTSVDYDSNIKHIENVVSKDALKIPTKESNSINYDNNKMYDNLVHNKLLATDESTTNAQIIQNTINTDSKFYDMMSSANYEPMTLTTTAKSDILVATSEYFDDKMRIETQSNADNRTGISSTKYIDTSILQSGQDMVFQFEKLLFPTTLAGDSDIQIGQAAPNTVPITTSDNITNYDGNLRYIENNINNETYTSESTFTNIDTNILFSSFTVSTDKPINKDSSKLNGLSNTKASTLSPFFWENPTFEYFEENMKTTASTQSPTTIKSQNSDSIGYIDFMTSNKKSEKDENNIVFNTEITNNTSIVIELNNPVISTNNNESSGTILNENLTQTQNSSLQTHINNTQNLDNKFSIFKSIGDVQNVIIQKDISVNGNINAHKITTQTNPKDRDDNFILDINENKYASGNISQDKIESNVNHNQIANTLQILTVPEVLVGTSSNNTVRAETENMTLAYSESQNKNSPTNIQNMTHEIKVSDSIFQKNTTSHWIDESNKQAKFAISSQIISDLINNDQPKGNLTELQINKANHSKLHNIQPNFVCLYRFRGKYADNENCRKFYICIGRQYPIIGMCPVNTVFSEFRKQCTTNLSHCVRNYMFYCTSEGRFSDIFNNNMYYICVKTPQNKFVRYKLQCENGYHLNKDSMQCVENVVKAQSTLDSDNSQRSSDTNSNESRKIINKGDNFRCEREGTFPVLNHCRKYYVCSKNKLTYKRKLKLCDSDEVFDKDKQKCVDAESYEC